MLLPTMFCNPNLEGKVPGWDLPLDDESQSIHLYIKYNFVMDERSVVQVRKSHDGAKWRPNALDNMGTTDYIYL